MTTTILIVAGIAWISLSIVIFSFWENNKSFRKDTFKKFGLSLLVGIGALILLTLVIGLLPLIALVFLGIWFSHKLDSRKKKEEEIKKEEEL